VPTLYVYSDMDDAICSESAELTADYVSGAYTYEVLPGVSHWVPELAPDDVNALMLAHIKP
jgi:pimeloyl-ACP methyl ester carboxylesterase